MTKYLVSVIVPIYKVEEYLDECITSILNQTYTNLEIILVNDGSPDNCGELCNSYARNDSRIVVLHKENGGLSDARNAGLEICKGDYISFIDSDDFVEPEFIEELLKSILSTNADLAICDFKEFGNLELIDSSTSFFDSECLSGRDILINYLDRVSSHHSKVNVVAWNKLYKKDLFSKIRFPKGLKYEDSFIMHEIYYNSSKVSICNKSLYNYRQRSNSLANTVDPISDFQRYLSIKTRFNFFSKNQFPLDVVSYQERKFVLELFKLKELGNRYAFSDFYKNIFKIYRYQHEIGKRRIVKAFCSF